MRKPLLEKDIQKSILEYLTLKRIFHYKNNTSGIYKQATGHYIPSQSVGAPDIVAVINGRYIGLEVKRPGGKMSEAQEIFRDRLTLAGGLYVTLYSLDQAIKVIDHAILKTK